MAQLRNSQGASGTTSSPDAALRGAKLNINLWESNQKRNLEAYEGETLLIVLKRAGLPLLAVCGGNGACGTCKVGFLEEWGARLASPSPREKRLLDFMKDTRAGDRLSCQIRLTEALNGLEVHARN